MKPYLSNLVYLLLLFTNVRAAINYRLSQPQIYVDDGHVYLVPAEHRNLILVTNGTGKILFNDLELNGLVASVTNSTKDLQSFKRIFGVPTNSSVGFSGRISHLEQSINRLSQLDALDARLISVERQIAYPNTNASTAPEGSSESGPSLPPPSRTGLAQRLSRLTNRVKSLENRVKNLGSASRNPCGSSPCSNGGTCIPTMFGAFCYCPKGWEGERCQLDVNECTAFLGTDLGCQNGGTCTNLPGTYQCQCRSGWFGIHCAQRGGDCSSGPVWELCGHGICVNQHGGSRPYTCICEQGWKTDGNNPACSVDVDECNGPHTSCSRNPPVFCINTPGSFHCGPCPNGYTGNGYQCTDLNECLQNNGGCSMNPMVQCLNTVGSRSCGGCPPGYIGNGESCQYVGICQVNNGGCHPLARCVGNPMIGQSFVQCMCPAGYTGTGMGLHGCIPYGGGGGGGSDTGIIPTSNPCSSNPCIQGSCTSYGNTFTCSCFSGYTGQTCAMRVDPCLSSPCQNGGTCRIVSMGFTCSCPNDFTGLLCELQEESCGGDFFTPEGTLRYPHSPSQTYNHNTNCMWRIITTPGKVLNVTFNSFHLEGAPDYCTLDWLQIHDGRESTSPLIGKFCGDELPQGGNITSTHESLFLWFRSDHSIAGLGFEFIWNTTESICGYTVEDQTHGSINSPGYPGKYPHNRDCMWSISVNPSKRIQLVFAALQIEVHPNCSYDYLEIKDGLEETAPQLAKYCNTTLPPPVISSGPHLVLRFHSDESSADNGFHVTFAEVPGIPGCGGVFTEAQGAFSSPQHPEPYPHGMDCEYLIRLPSVDERITLTFLSFELENAVNCRWDYVEVRDGNRPDSPLVGRFCNGQAIPPMIRSSSNSLFVRFRSDSSIAFGGFRAQYRAVCGGIFATPQGILRSPYYPAAYPKNRDCIYIISQPVNQAIRLDFQDFEVESANDARCIFDYLEVRDGDDENSTLIGHFCGRETMPDPIISSLNYLWLRFRTDASIQNRGFLANYSTFDISCGGILKATHGILSSPGHPEVYPHGISCKWIIRGIPGQVIRLNWVSFSLERNTNCRYDAVELYDNSTYFNRNGSLIGRYCGNELPPTITSSDYTMTVNFISDHSVAHDGFMANYVLVNSTTVCGGNYFTTSGALRTPGYPRQYPNGKSCTWTIRVPIGRQIMLNVTDFDLENGTSNGCVYDYLEIRNGGYLSSPLIGKFCGSNLPPRRIPSFSNSLFLKFSTDISKTGNGFQIFWDGSSQGCGGTLNGPSGSIDSPNYPMSYSSRTECFWTITVNQGSAIQFTFVDLDLQRSSECWGEYVEIRDGRTADSRIIGKYCVADTVLAINSTKNSLRIKFVSNYGSGRGFHATYQSICTREITGGHTGVIESPNFPEPYPHHRSCAWTIKAPMGNMLNISFSHFSLELSHSVNCTYDFVEISEFGHFDETPTQIQKFCGDTIPSMISSTKENVLVRFESDATTAMNGFRLEWVVNGCGGHIIGNWGDLKSPNYPNPYPRSVQCDWVITTEPGTKVQLTIYELDMEASENCVFDYLKIYGGAEENSPLMHTFCHKTETTTAVVSHGNTMLVKFASDGSVGGKGFYGYISALQGGCGGRIRAPTGFIYSPNYPSNYDSDDDCGWLITVDYQHVVELQFLEFNIERHINCSYDYVAVYDGRTSSAPLLLTACGNDIPPNVKSTGNQIFVRLRTDESATAKGFKASFTMGCGARLVSETSGEIVSPGYPHFMYKMNCTWFIMGPQPEDRVTLTFTHIDLQSRVQTEENCSTSYVEVLDGEDLDAPSVGKYCLSRVPPSLTSQGNGFVVRILTTDVAFGFGFRAIYDVSTSACGGTLTSAEGSFTSPNYPIGYPTNAECVWRIQASAGNRVSISFRRMNIEASDYCNLDFVEIHENDASGRLLGHFCGTDIPSNLTASEVLWVLFRSDSDGQAPGFFVDYSLVHGNELNGSAGTIESPLFPLPYNLIGTFSWRISVNFSQSIQIMFTHFDFGYDEPNARCSNFLKIFDGYDETATVLISRCDQALPETVTSTGNVLFVSFVKQIPSMQSIFRFNWNEVPTVEQSRTELTTNITGCGGNITILDGRNITTLLSPGFTENGYPPDARCEWIINTIGSHRIQIKVESLELEGHPNCLYDRVEIYDGLNGLPNFELNQTLCLRTEEDALFLSSGRTVKIIFVSDSSYNRQGFNFSLSTQCGGIIQDTRGRITSPNYPQNYGNSQCAWIINVRPGRTIGLTFELFDIYSGGQTQCSTDQLILRNGGMPDSPFLGQGRYCGNTIPTIPETTGNKLSVNFTAWTSGGRGFAFIFTEISAGCGGQIHLTDDAPNVIISSPQYPNMPPPFTECEWVFSAPQNEVLQLEFQLSFQLANTYGCTTEGVEIRDGGTQLSRQIGLFCRDMPGTQKTTGNIMYVRYYTTINEPQNGFKAKVSIGTCGGTVVGWSGLITSPGYPTSYDINLNCEWIIRGPQSSFLNLYFTDLEIPSGSNSANASNVNCTTDSLTVTEEGIEGLEIYSPRNWSFCGLPESFIPSPVRTSMNQVRILFHSDSSRETLKGFRIWYHASTERCGGTLTSPTGIIQTPGYPRAYPHYRYCYWTIRAPVGRRIRLEFLDFDLEEKILSPDGRESCPDSVRVSQGRFLRYNQTRLCGTQLPPPIETTTNELFINFRTDGSVSHRGFKASYTTDLPSVCGGDLIGDYGNVSTPVEWIITPNSTSHFACTWQHPGDSSSGTTIITLNDVRIPPWETPGTACVYGILNISPILSSSYSWAWRGYCKPTSEKLYLPGSGFRVAYMAGHIESYFNLTYQVVACGGVFTGPNDTITSPNFPNNYQTNIECIWILDYSRGSGGSQIRLVFTDLDLQDHRNNDGCDKDFVVVRNGKYPSSPILGKYCGTNMPSEIISMSLEVWIEFHSDGESNGNGRGFKIEAEVMRQGCGGTIHNKRGRFGSPRVGESTRTSTSTSYPPNAECEWIIESVPGYVVNIVFTGRFDLEVSTNCTNDFIEIFSKQSNFWKSVGKFCGKQLPSAINTTSTSVKVLFRSNQAIGGDGFELFWYSFCGGVYTEESGLIRSAHYDRFNHSYHSEAGDFTSYSNWEYLYQVYSCDYIIQGNSTNDYIVTEFLPPFDISYDQSAYRSETNVLGPCPYVNVSLIENSGLSRYSRGSMAGPYCGQGENLPPSFMGRWQIRISYNYMPILHNFGFRIRYSIYQCGGVIMEPKSVASPGHPFPYASNMNCTWVVTAPVGKVVRFKIEKLELEYSGNCYWDAIKLYDGDTINESRKLGTFCGNLTESLGRISSKSNVMTLQFVTDSSVHHSGFLGSFDFTIGEVHGCGGTVNASSQPQVIQSVDFNRDGKYDSFLECNWLVVGADFQIVELLFTSFVLEGRQRAGRSRLNSSDDCPYDFVEIRDGTGPNGGLLGKFCSSNIPPRIISSTNFMWITFLSDGSYEFSGFTARVTSLPSPCGGTFVLNATSVVQVLTSPNYPENYPSNLRCKWTVDGARFHDEVDIRFLDLQIESSRDCSKDYLQIRDISTSYTSPEGIGGPILFNGNRPVDWRFRNLNIEMESIMQNFRYCGSQTPSDFFSIGRSAEIMFSTDSYTVAKGFKVEYKASGCNRTFENLQGRIFSPEWPTHSPMASNCFIFIRAQNGSFISIFFNQFLLLESDGCSESYLEIRENNPSGQLLARYCGSSIPNPIFANTNVVFMNFFTRFRMNRGYDISYTTTSAGIGCGGDLFHTGGSLASPMYPSNFSQQSDCRWRIRVPAGLKIQLEFTNFIIGGDCSNDFVELFSMNSHQLTIDPVLFTRYCPGDTPSTYNGETDMVMIRYKTSLNNSGIGWRIEFRGITPTVLSI